MCVHFGTVWLPLNRPRSHNFASSSREERCVCIFGTSMAFAEPTRSHNFASSSREERCVCILEPYEASLDDLVHIISPRLVKGRKMCVHFVTVWLPFKRPRSHNFAYSSSRERKDVCAFRNRMASFEPTSFT
ncbi:hypothetical protein AVEN_43976-1 [Araneus ventricosus]|uniref:Uncharacterized protein n=1 Tax=Araneus ventricosus TaxID=182803 RepID=A0A4Y2T5N4_ARAVE|nr:hypothetical protein AVEN_43976-1 [Araneus ventricosus]